jgi:hypothetical protein
VKKKFDYKNYLRNEKNFGIYAIGNNVNVAKKVKFNPNNKAINWNF